MSLVNNFKFDYLRNGQDGFGADIAGKALSTDVENFERSFATKDNHNSKLSTDIENLKQSFQSSFTLAAKDKEGFYALLDQAFGSNYDRDAAENIRQAALKEDFSWLPKTTILDSNVFSAAHLDGRDIEGGVFLGAFDKSENSILINNSVLSNKGLANSIYAEEVGHALDNILNHGADAKGDEGAIFSKLLSGETLTSNQLKSLQSENDHGVVGGREVEFALNENPRHEKIYYQIREHIFAVAYHDVVAGNNDIGSANPQLNNAKYRQQVLLDLAKSAVDDPTNKEKAIALESFIALIADQHGINGARYYVDLDQTPTNNMLDIRFEYDQHKIDEEEKGNFLLHSSGYGGFIEHPTHKNGPTGEDTDGAAGRQRNYQSRLNDWATRNIFALLSYDADIRNDEVANDLKIALATAFNNQTNDPKAYEAILKEASLRYENLSLKEINKRVSKGLGFEGKVQELAEKSPEALKVFLQFYYKEVNEELAQRGLPAIELKSDFVDKLITKLTSSDATIKAEGQSTVSEIFTYVEQLDIAIQIEAYDVYQDFQIAAKEFGTELKGLDDETLENYVNTFIRVMGEQNPDIVIDYGDDPIGSIVKILDSDTPESRKALEGIYVFVNQQLTGSEVLRTELAQVIDKENIFSQIIQMAKNSDSAVYDYAKILLDIEVGADFTSEQRSIIDALLTNIKGGDPATYKETLDGAFELVKSLDTDARKVLDDRYQLFVGDMINKKRFIADLTSIAYEDSTSFHAIAKEFFEDNYNFDTTESIRKRVTNGEEGVLSNTYELINARRDGIKNVIYTIIDQSNKRRTFNLQFITMAHNKDFFHEAGKLAREHTAGFLTYSDARGLYDEEKFESFRLSLVAAIDSKDTALVNQLMEGTYNDTFRGVTDEINDVYDQFLLEEEGRASYESQLIGLADSESDFLAYIQLVLGDDYSDDMKATVEEWRVTIRDKKEGYKDLLTTAYDYHLKPENTNSPQLDYLLDKSELEGMLVDLSKNEALFSQYVERYLQAAYPDGNYPNDVQSMSKELLAKIKTDGRQALEGVFDQQILFDQKSKEDLFGIISLSNAETSFKTKFTALAKSPEKFNALMEKTFGNAYNKDNAEELRIKASKGDFSWLPTIQIAGADIFAKASLNGDQSTSANFLGAYDGNHIILNEGILFNNKTLDRVLTSELGHALDQEINDGKDAKGDEGEIFQRLLFGEEITNDQLAALQIQEDQGKLAGLNVEFDAVSFPVAEIPTIDLPTVTSLSPIFTTIYGGEDRWIDVWTRGALLNIETDKLLTDSETARRNSILHQPTILDSIDTNFNSGSSNSGANNSDNSSSNSGSIGGSFRASYDNSNGDGFESYNREVAERNARFDAFHRRNSEINDLWNSGSDPGISNTHQPSYDSVYLTSGLRPVYDLSSRPNLGVVAVNPSLVTSASKIGSPNDSSFASNNAAFSFSSGQAANPESKPESESPFIRDASLRAKQGTPATWFLAKGDDTDLNTLFRTGGKLNLNARGQADFVGKNASIFAEAFIEKLRNDGKLQQFLNNYVPDSPLTTKDREYDAIKKMTGEFSNYSISNGEPESKVLRDAIVTNGGLENLDLKVDEGTRIFLPLSVYKDVPIDSPFYKKVLNDYSVEGLVGALDGLLTHDISNKLGISTTDLVDELKPGQSSEMVFRLNHDGSKGPISVINNNALSIKVARDESKGSYTVTVTSSTKLGLGIGLEAPEAFSSKLLQLKASASGAIPESSIYVYEVATAEEAKIIAQLAEQQANSSMLAFNDPVDGWTNISEANRRFLNDHSVQNASSTGFEGKAQFDFGTVVGSKGYGAKTNIVTRLERGTPTSGQTVHEVSLEKGTTVTAKQVVGVISGETKLHDINTNLTIFHNGKKWNDYNADTKQVSLSFKNINQAGAETITPRYNIDPNKLDLSSDTFKNWYFGDGQNRNHNGHQASFLSYLDSNGVSRDFDESNPPTEVKTWLAAYVLEAIPIQPHNPDLMSEIVNKPATTTPDIHSYNDSHKYFSDIFGEKNLDGISIDFKRTGGDQNKRFLKIDSQIKSPVFGLGASVSHVLTNATSDDPLGRWELGD